MANATAGDRIEISPGTYYEFGLVMVSGVALVGMGSSAPDVVIDARNQGRVLLCEGLEGNTLLYNLTFKGGLARGETAYDQSGGAVLVSNGSVRIQYCLFTQNRADASGGAIRCSYSSPIVSGCRFVGNEAPAGGGGAIDCSFESAPLLTNCYFQDNLAAWGAALSCRDDSTPFVSDCSFDGNTADGDRAYGGAVYADYASMPEFQRCTFYGNQARYGGGLACFTSAHSNLDHCTVVENRVSIDGGGLFCLDSSPVISNSIIAFQQGNALTCYGQSQPRISCSDLYGNYRGDWVGCLTELAGTAGNLAVDPMFCQADPEVDFNFTLDSSSPCAEGAAGCEVMGAWPTGCSPTPIFLTDFTGEWSGLTPELTWEVNLTRETPVFRLTRAEAGSGTETVIEYRETSLGTFAAVDANLEAEPGQTYIYRLYLLDSSGQWLLLREFSLAPPANAPYLRLLGAWPNPFNPRTSFSFEVGRPQRVVITIYDLEGRLVRRLADRTFPAGKQSVAWNGLTDTGRTAGSGTYVVLVQGRDAQHTLKVTLLK